MPPIRMLPYDPNRYEHDPRRAPLTPKDIMKLARNAAKIRSTVTPEQLGQPQTAPKKKPQAKKAAKKSPMKYRPHSPISASAETSAAPKLRVAGILFRLPDNRILVSRRSKDRLTCPGAFCIPGGEEGHHESSRDAALRECKEETGLRVDAKSLERMPTILVENAIGEKYLSTCFLLDVTEAPKGIQNLEPTKQDNWIWVKMDDLLNEDLVPGLRAAIEALGVMKSEKVTKAKPTKTKAATKATAAETKAEAAAAIATKAAAAAATKKKKMSEHPDVDLFNRRMGVKS